MDERLEDIEERLEYLEEELPDNEERNIAIAESFRKINERLDALESHERSESKLNEIQARQVWKDLERGPPEHKAEVERRVNDMMKELKDNG